MARRVVRRFIDAAARGLSFLLSGADVFVCGYIKKWSRQRHWPSGRTPAATRARWRRRRAARMVRRMFGDVDAFRRWRPGRSVVSGSIRVPCASPRSEGEKRFSREPKRVLASRAASAAGSRVRSVIRRSLPSSRCLTSRFPGVGSVDSMGLCARTGASGRGRPATARRRRRRRRRPRRQRVRPRARTARRAARSSSPLMLRRLEGCHEISARHARDASAAARRGRPRNCGAR